MKKFDDIKKLQREFGGWQKIALKNALEKMRDIGFINEHSNPTKNWIDKEHELVDIFQKYYYYFLEIEKKTPTPRRIGEFL